MKALLETLTTSAGTWRYVSLPEAERRGVCASSRLPYVLRVLLENVLRQRTMGGGCAEDVEALAAWPSVAAHIQLRPGRVMMDDTAGLPLRQSPCRPEPDGCNWRRTATAPRWPVKDVEEPRRRRPTQTGVRCRTGISPATA